MEHLGIDTTRHRHLRIPLQTHESVAPYRGESFDEYLSSTFPSTELLLREFEALNSPSDHSRPLCLLQNLCFFALLRSTLAVLGVPSSVEDFVVQDEYNESWISLSNFPNKARQAAFARARNVLQKYNQNPRFLTESRLANAPTCAIAFVARCELPSEDDEQLLRQIFPNLEHTAHLLNKLTDSLNNQRAMLLLFTDVDYQLIFVCSILLRTLQSLVEQLFPQLARRQLSQYWTSPSAFDAFARLHGWCLNRIVGYPGDQSVAALMMSMPANSTKIHGPDITSLMKKLSGTRGTDKLVREEIGRKLYHDLAEDTLPPCEDRLCFRLTKTDGTLRPLHRCQEPESCPSLFLDQQELVASYKRGSYPLLAFDTSDDVLSIRIEEYKDGLAYSALSHVWSHGLGNATENSLPLCQLRFLLSISDEAVPGGPMWVDSICVPVAPEHKEARSLAITRMAQVYKSATRTVILDKNIAQSDFHHYTTGLELLCSEWARRLWTLQEAVLPGSSKLMLCLKNGLVQWNQVSNTTSIVQDQLTTFIMNGVREIGFEVTDQSLFHQLTPIEGVFVTLISNFDGPTASLLPVLEIWNPVEHVIRQHVQEMLEVIGVNAAADSNCLLKAYSAIHRRSASVSSDEFICISQLLGLDLATFPALPTSMDTVVERLPVADNIIFLPGARVTRRGFRWCPSSFLSQEDVSVDVDTSHAELTKHGIKIRKSALVSQRSIVFSTGKQFILWEQGIPVGRFSITRESFIEARRGRSMEYRQILVRRPAFILIREIERPSDFPQRTLQRTLRFTVVDIDAPSVNGSEDVTRAIYIFNYVLIRMQDGDNVPPMWDGAVENIPVAYQPPSQWIID